MNIMAIAVAALVPMALGIIWYHPKVLGGIWMRESGMTGEKMKQGNMFLKYGLALVFSFMIAFALNSLVVHDSFVKGAMYYKTNRTMVPEPGSELAKWYDYYKTNLSTDDHRFTHGAFHGFFLIGVFIALPLLASNAIFEGKGWKYVLVNGLYWILSVTLMGGIIAAWR
jgi:hypothetical protein